MKSIKIMLLVVAIAFSGSLSATTTPKKETGKSFTTAVGKLLKSPKFILEEETVVLVKLTFNDEGEIVVLSTNAKSEVIESFITSRLNYANVVNDIKDKSKDYIIPVRLVPEY